MDPNGNIQPEERAPLVTYEDVAGRLELSLTRPDLNEEDVDAACRKALAYSLGAVVVRPSDADMAARILGGTGVALASVAGFPTVRPTPEPSSMKAVTCFAAASKK